MTILVIGGAAQGKRAFAQARLGLSDEDFASGAVCAPNEITHARAVDGLHLLTRRFAESDFLPLLRGKIVLCDEIGCGVVPAVREEENWRERTGRLLCALAGEADVVVRVVAGIPQVIKGDAVWN